MREGRSAPSWRLTRISMWVGAGAGAAVLPFECLAMVLGSPALVVVPRLRLEDRGRNLAVGDLRALLGEAGHGGLAPPLGVGLPQGHELRVVLGALGLGPGQRELGLVVRAAELVPE